VDTNRSDDDTLKEALDSSDVDSNSCLFQLSKSYKNMYFIQ